jgi:hypothetical protein
VAERAVGETRSAAPWRDVVLFAVVLLVGVVVLVAGLILASALMRTPPTRPPRRKAPDEEDLSPYISAVFVGDRRLPVVEGVAHRRRKGPAPDRLRRR